jgi:hypothetical protein
VGAAGQKQAVASLAKELAGRLARNLAQETVGGAGLSYRELGPARLSTGLMIRLTVPHSAHRSGRGRSISAADSVYLFEG